MNNDNIQLARISARGVVQGVGFRPFVYGLASHHGLNGWVCNTSEDVKIEVEGDRKTLDLFISDLEKKAPSLARIENISFNFAAPAGYTVFEIRHSLTVPGRYQMVSPDIATCQPCLEDIFTAGNRRFHYPFTNCTNCGPRFTIIKDIPYDRPLTTMSIFNMCPDCQREYEDPLDRRFHAQPSACPICGPRLQLTDNQGKLIKCDDIIVKTAEFLKEGRIIAIKGLGGFLLACNAENAAPVSLLRQRKRRPSKPFAVMLKDIEDIRRHCEISEAEEKLLLSPQAPIVLVRWKAGSTICHETGPALRYLGVMLPYTPIHHLLLRETGLPLIMTSGNISEEPIAGENTEALRRLAGIADYFLLHNRDIYSTYDDSVAMVVNNVPQLVRRARGYAPYPVHLTYSSPQILACGAEEKNTFCLTRENHAFVSQHIGDMENLETLEYYEHTIKLYKQLFRIQPDMLAYDMHPEYLPTKYAIEQAEKTGARTVPVQHHHAHIVSCLADNATEGPAIGLAFDGTGYGPDGKIWGGEFMIVDYQDFKRVGQLEYLPLPGGAAAIKKPCRIALGYLLALSGGNLPDSRLGFLSSIDKTEMELVRRQVESNINCPLTSSMGRLFDAVSAMAGIRSTIDYEAQAAIEMEMKAYQSIEEQGSYPFTVTGDDSYHIILLHELISAVAGDLLRGCPQSIVSMRFHNTIAAMAADVCLKIRQMTGLNTTALSGGCFQNRLLLNKVSSRLESAGFAVLTHKQVPCNDGGISLGQAIIAANQGLHAASQSA
ncbi:MAG: carbamoyltransferase HypF [Dehalococcoidia bacterium]|nr:carbamoyltransferase HypF [Dehalococcoidia bacterium]